MTALASKVMPGLQQRSLPLRWVNVACLFAGLGFTLCLFLSVARFLDAQEKETGAAPREDLDMVAIAMPPLPPPPKVEERPAFVEGNLESLSLGFEEAPSSSPVKILPSPPSFDDLLPLSQLPAQVMRGVPGMDATLKPELDVSYSADHVFQKNEVDKPPRVISRPDPSVPGRLLGFKSELSVLLLFVVDTQGVVTNPRVLRSSGVVELDEILRTSVNDWVFTPAIRKGRPVRCIIQQQIRLQTSGRGNPFSLQ